MYIEWDKQYPDTKKTEHPPLARAIGKERQPPVPVPTLKIVLGPQSSPYTNYLDLEKVP